MKNMMPDWSYSIGRAGTYRYEVDIGEQFKIANLKSKLWNGTDISKITPRALQVET